MITKQIVGAGALALLAGTAAAQDSESAVTRHPLPDSDFPILQAVEVPADATLVYLSGTVPAVTDEEAEPDTMAAYGDTETQTVSVLTRIEDTLESLDLSMGDVIKMQAFLVAPEEGEGMDFSGFMDGYTQFFDTEAQPEVVTRSVIEVAGLANPNWLVEIEVTAVRP